jgi:hypothetical protein
VVWTLAEDEGMQTTKEDIIGFVGRGRRNVDQGEAE